MCVQTGSVKEHLTGKVIPEKIREYMGSRRTECHKRNYEKSGRSVKSVAKDGHKKGAESRSFLNYHVFEKTH